MPRPDRNPIGPGASALGLRRTAIAVAITFALLPFAFGTASAEIFLDAAFTTGADGFAYGDDVFRSTNSPAHASGSHLVAGGETGGGLQVALGNVDVTTVNGMSGGWSRTFVLDRPTDDVELSLRFNLSQSPEYESDELSQLMVAVDGVLLPGAGVDFVAQVVGNGNGGAIVTTGWIGFARTLGSLAAGPHTVLIGAYNNRKTFDNEATDVRIDDVLVTGNPISACVVDAECDDSNPCTDDLCSVGTCTHSNNTLTCDDGLGCTGGDICSAGSCVGADLCVGDSSCNPISASCEEPATQSLVDALDPAGFRGHIAALSSSASPINGSRHWSQPGNAAALDYIQARFESYGYVVVRHAYTYSSQTRQNIYATKVGATRPDEMWIVSAHMDSVNQESAGSVFAPGANDDASGTALVLEAARVFADPEIVTERSLRFLLWNNEETGLNGSNAYVANRRSLQGIESPPGSGLYPEPRWIGVIAHDQLLWDHGLPSGPVQIAGADIDIEYQASSSFAAQSLALANVLHQANIDHAPGYPSEVSNDMCCTDSVPFQNDVASISVRDNRRRSEIGNGSNPTWHRNSDVYATYSDADFALGFSAVQATVGAVALLADARRILTCGDGVLDAGEGCDDGNLLPGDCCTPVCTLEAEGAVCRSAVGSCDAAEVCDGVAGLCPADVPRAAGAVCRVAAGVCDSVEQCDGEEFDCPADLKRTDECRGAIGGCDVAEACDGAGDDCPGDLHRAEGVECRSSAGPCDVSEVCSGITADCPVDATLDAVACVDDDACTTGEVCAVGSCVASGTLDCDDDDPCTAESCDASSGCRHEPIAGCVEPPPGVPTGSGPTPWVLVTALLLLATIAHRRLHPDPPQPRVPGPNGTSPASITRCITRRSW